MREEAADEFFIGAALILCEPVAGVTGTLKKLPFRVLPPPSILPILEGESALSLERGEAIIAL